MKNIFLVIFIVGIFLLLPQSIFASTLSLSPGKTTIPIGGTVAVSVRLNAGGDPVNAISAFLSYPADKLDVTYVSPGSAFAIGAENTYGGGTIKISRGSLNGVSGSVNVATIGFKGKAAGVANVSFIGGSSAPRASDSSDSLNLSGSSGGTFTVGGIAATPVPKNTTAPTKPGQPVVVSDTNLAQLIISDITVINVASGSASIAWKTNREADSTVEYGLEKGNYFLKSSSETLVSAHKVKLESAMMLPGYKIHYLVKSKDKYGSEVQGIDQEFQIPGYQIKIKVTDESEKPLKDAEVLLYSDPKKMITDINGEATFTNVSADKHLVVIKISDIEKTFEINVLGKSNPQESESFSFKVNPEVKGVLNIKMSQWIMFFGVISITVIILGIIFIILKKKYKIDQKVPPGYS